MPARQHAPQRAAGADQVILTNHIAQGLRAKPVGQRARRGGFKTGGLEQIAHECDYERALSRRQRARRRHI